MVDQAALSSAERVKPRLALNYVLLSGAEFAAKVMGALAFARLARVLGPVVYGRLEFAVAVIVVLTLVIDSGLSAYTAREVAHNREAAVHYALHLVLLRMALAIAALGLLAAYVAIAADRGSMRQLLMLYGLTLLGVPGLLQGVFQGLDQMHYVALASITRWTIFSLGVFAFVHGPQQLWIVPLVEGGGILGQVVLYCSSARHTFRIHWQRPDPRFSISMLWQALPIGMSEWVWAIKVYFATVWLATWLGGSEVGWFGAAHRMVISLHTFVWLYFFNLLPSMSRSWRGEVDALVQLVRKSMRLTIWAGLFVGIVGTVLSGPLVALLYGQQYEPSAEVFRWLIWLIPLTLWHGHYRYALIACGQQRLEFVATACGAGVNIILNLLLIPSRGAVGAAWALIGSELTIGGLVYVSARRAIARLPMWSVLYRPIGVGVVLVAVLYLLPTESLVLLGTSAILLYGMSIVVIESTVVRDLPGILGKFTRMFETRAGD